MNCKFTEAEEEFICSYRTLWLWKNLTLQQRVEEIKVKFDKERFTRAGLSLIYKRNRIGNLKPSYKWHLGKVSEDDYIDRKRQNIRKIMNYMQAGRDMIYLDETSTHMWEKRSRVWMPKDNPIYLRLKRDRGHSRTVIGAICLKLPNMKYMVCDKTNGVNFREFLLNLSKEVDPKNCVIVLDNHAAHRSETSVEYAE